MAMEAYPKIYLYRRSTKIRAKLFCGTTWMDKIGACRGLLIAYV